MDTRTGNIFSPEEADLLLKENRAAFQRYFVQIDEDEMTEKQKETQQVSKHDNKSRLGKKFTAARFQRKYFFQK